MYRTHLTHHNAAHGHSVSVLLTRLLRYLHARRLRIPSHATPYIFTRLRISSRDSYISSRDSVSTRHHACAPGGAAPGRALDEFAPKQFDRTHALTSSSRGAPSSLAWPVVDLVPWSVVEVSSTLLMSPTGCAGRTFIGTPCISRSLSLYLFASGSALCRGTTGAPARLLSRAEIVGDCKIVLKLSMNSAVLITPPGTSRACGCARGGGRF